MSVYCKALWCIWLCYIDKGGTVWYLKKKKYKPEKQDNKGPFKKKKVASFYTLCHLRAVHRNARGQKFTQPSTRSASFFTALGLRTWPRWPVRTHWQMTLTCMQTSAPSVVSLKEQLPNAGSSRSRTRPTLTAPPPTSSHSSPSPPSPPHTTAPFPLSQLRLVASVTFHTFLGTVKKAPNHNTSFQQLPFFSSTISISNWLFERLPESFTHTLSSGPKQIIKALRRNQHLTLSNSRPFTANHCRSYYDNSVHCPARRGRETCASSDSRYFLSSQQSQPWHDFIQPSDL